MTRHRQHSIQHFEECDHRGQLLTVLVEFVQQQQHLQKHSTK